MSSVPDPERLLTAHQTVRADLLAHRSETGAWHGELSSSPLSTATAISALVLAEQGGMSRGLPAFRPGAVDDSRGDELYRGDLSELIVESLHWLAGQQNEDGGWGDTDRSASNVATTMLVEAAFHLTGVPAKFTDMLARAEQYIAAAGGPVAALKRRFQGDKTFAAPILANYALAGLISWRKVPALPFEFACVPQNLYRLCSLPVVSYAIPALVAIGQAKLHHAPPRNLLMRAVRKAARGRSLRVVDQMQPASGGFLEATPLTSFVVMCLASIGQENHPIVRRGVEFLLASVRSDGSWPIDTNLATWNTSQAVVALDWGLNGSATDAAHRSHPSPAAAKTLDWLLACQHTEKHPFTGAQPGGWAWTNLAGGVPDADDTAAALIALAAWRQRWPDARRKEVTAAARRGLVWLVDLQNRDGGWPTFCRGWSKLPFDRSSTDITAHALRALDAWHDGAPFSVKGTPLAERMSAATRRGVAYLIDEQQPTGGWLPLWFGNENHPREENPVYGTAKVLMAFSQLQLTRSQPARKAAGWLAGVQHASGGWGVAVEKADAPTPKSRPLQASVEETALAIAALTPFVDHSDTIAQSHAAGLDWLVEVVENGRHLDPAPIGFYFAKLWYYERLYPQIFATGALAAACKQLATSRVAVPTEA